MKIKEAHEAPKPKPNSQTLLWPGTVLKERNTLTFVLNVCCHNNTSNWDKLKCGKVTKVVNKG